MMPADCDIRPATEADVRDLQHLIAESARGLSASLYSPAQVEAALRGAWGVDTQLIRDGTYVAVVRQGRIVGCGGWSFRRTLFGADAGRGRDATRLDPLHDPAKIRAFFVHPAHARQGIASAILERCERDAAAAGFGAFELMATLPGVPFYAAHGYVRGESVPWDLGDGLMIEFVPMVKRGKDST